MSDRWLTFNEAAEIVRARVGGNRGRSEALVRAARASGEVRTKDPLFLNDDGIVGARPLTQIGVRRFSEDDLLDWLDRQHLEIASKSSPSKGGGQPIKLKWVEDVIKDLYPNGVPDQAVLENGLLCTQVQNRLKADRIKQGVPVAPVSDTTILRGAGRKKK
jgi:hypothetical protein